MNKRLQALCARALPAIFLLSPSLAAQSAPSKLFAAIAQADLRLERIGYRLTTANASACHDLAPAAGMVVRSLREYAPDYREQARDALGFETPIVIEAIIAGSPAADAGLAVGDGLIAVEDRAAPHDVPDAHAPAALDDLDAAILLLDFLPIDALGRLTIRRHGTDFPLRIAAKASCRSHFALVLGGNLISDADGSTVRIGAPLVERLDDAGLAVIVAHELAHNILGHPAERRRLDLRDGIAGEFGRSAKITLQQEDEADRLSVHLLARAGYDPASVGRFWRGQGRDLLGILPRGPSHRGWRGRAALADQEAGKIDQ
jgi:Zn-dependent protease with chaperone function